MYYRKLVLLFLSIVFAWSQIRAANAEPGVVVLTFSKSPEIAKKCAEARKWLTQLQKANKLDDLDFSIAVVDLADPAQAGVWSKRFEVGKADLPALAFVTRKGNKIADVPAVVRQYSDPMKAAGMVFRQLQKLLPAVTVIQIGTGFNVTSIPDGATVYVNGEEKGTTPLAGIEVPAGKPVKLEVKHADASDWSATYTLNAGETKQVQVTLQTLDGVAEFNAPAPTAVFLDGNKAPAGTTPCRISGLRAGAHAVVCKADGYHESAFDLRVAAGKLTVVQCNLAPKRVRVALTVNSKGLKVAYTNTQPEYHYGRQTGNYTTQSGEHNYEVDNRQVGTLTEELLAKDPRLVVVSGTGDWDLGIQIEGSISGIGPALKISGGASLLDKTGVKVAGFPFDKGINLFTIDKGAAATKLMKQFVTETVPKILVDLSKYAANLPAPAPIPPTVTVREITR